MFIVEAPDIPVDVPSRNIGAVGSSEDGTVENGHGGVEDGCVEEEDQPPYTMPHTWATHLVP